MTNKEEIKTFEERQWERDESAVLEAAYQAKNSFVPDEYFFETIETRFVSPLPPSRIEAKLDFTKDLNNFIGRAVFARCSKCFENMEIGDYCCGRKVMQ
jgi:hypothetical protein